MLVRANYKHPNLLEIVEMLKDNIHLKNNARLTYIDVLNNSKLRKNVRYTFDNIRYKFIDMEPASSIYDVCYMCKINKSNVKFELCKIHLSGCLKCVKRLPKLECPICRIVSNTLMIV